MKMSNSMKKYLIDFRVITDWKIEETNLVWEIYSPYFLRVFSRWSKKYPYQPKKLEFNLKKFPIFINYTLATFFYTKLSALYPFLIHGYRINGTGIVFHIQFLDSFDYNYT